MLRKLATQCVVTIIAVSIVQLIIEANEVCEHCSGPLPTLHVVESNTTVEYYHNHSSNTLVWCINGYLKSEKNFHQFTLGNKALTYASSLDDNDLSLSLYLINDSDACLNNTNSYPIMSKKGNITARLIFIQVTKAIPCSDSPQLRNGDVLVKDEDSTYNQIAWFRCYNGFYLNGSTTLTCNRTSNVVQGSWSGPTPTCEPILCKRKTLDNGITEYSACGGESTKDSETYGTVATYRCHDGYTLIGNTKQTCLNGSDNIGYWSGSLPQCEPDSVTCEPLEPPQNGNITYNGTRPGVNGSVAIYACDNGTVLLGQPMIRVCSISTDGIAKWTGEQPVCIFQSTLNAICEQNKTKPCPTPPEIFGGLLLGGFLVGILSIVIPVCIGRLCKSAKGDKITHTTTISNPKTSDTRTNNDNGKENELFDSNLRDNTSEN